MYPLRVEAVVVLAVVLAGFAPLRGAEVPPRTEAGQTLVVPAAQLDAGDVYYVAPGEDTQILCTSDALLQRSVATCNRVVGYVVVPFEPAPDQPPLIAGAFRLPVASLTTGTAQYDKLLQGKPLLNVAEFPEITALLLSAGRAERTLAEKAHTQYKLPLDLQLNIKGKVLELEAPAQLDLLPFTWRVMNRNVGEMLTLRTRLELKLADLGLEKPGREYADRIADTLSLEVFLLCNTVSPEKNNDPKYKGDQYAKQLRFLTLTRDFRDAEKGYAAGRAYMREIWDNPALLQVMAQLVLDEDGLARRDLDFALEAARRANELTRFVDLTQVRTLAQVCHDRGDPAAAAKHLRTAIEANRGAPAEQLSELRALLQEYETPGKPSSRSTSN